MTSRFDVLVPYSVRRAVLANGEGGPLPYARGDVAGADAELVGDRARLELRRGAEVAAHLDLQDWTAASRGELLPVPPETEAFRLQVTTGGQQLAGEVAKIKHGRSLLGEATRYWRLAGEDRVWFWGNGPAPEAGSRSRAFHLWREEPVDQPLVEVTITALEQRGVETAVSAAGEATSSSSATEVDEELAVLLAVGGFQVELVGRNERLAKTRKWLTDVVVDDVTGPPYR